MLTFPTISSNFVAISVITYSSFKAKAFRVYIISRKTLPAATCNRMSAS